MGEQSTIPRIVTYIKNLMSIAAQPFSVEFMCHPGISKQVLIKSLYKN
jgi:hypothetical protein